MTAPARNFLFTIKQRWDSFVGKPSEFTLEARIFHSICLGLVLLMLIYTPYDFFAGLYIASISCVIFGSIFFYEYYRSRFLGRGHRSLIFGTAGLLLLSVNYFANAGIDGSTDLIWPAYLLLVLTICPYRYMIRWIVVYLVVFGLIHVVESLYPGLVQHPFRAGAGQFTDRITAVPIPVIGMAIVIGLLRRNYDKERAVVAQRDAEKSRLLSILSHDLRAPFIQIQQYFELLKYESLSQADRRRLEQALKQTNDQTLNLVTNLLYWSRSQLDGFSMRLTTLPVAATLKTTLEITTGLSAEKGITLIVNIHPDIHVTADADMLQLVIRNLLQNAIKFTAPGGTIKIETEADHNNCRIHVKDNGAGIRPEQLAKLFSEAKPTIGTANEKGVGLGLQLCKEFMERQGGSIGVESELGKGSRFTVNIPLAEH